MRSALVINPSKGGWERALDAVTDAADEAGWPEPTVHLTTREETGHAQASAALAHGAIDDPERMDDHLEAIAAHGFGDRGLDGLAQELVRLRLSGQSLDSAAMRRHLAQSGHDALVREVEKAAAKSGAPFLAANAPLAEARVRWSQAFDASTRVAALEDALAQARDVPGQDEAFRRLKAERDALRRAIKAGTIWEDSAGT